MQNLQTELIELLKKEDNLVVDNQLNKNKIIEAALKVEPFLIRLLINNSSFKKHFFQEVEKVLVFDKIKFQRFVNNKSFLPDSYTAFKNKIGLLINDGTTDNFIKTKNDVVLAWPHKDCVLEGGQTKEDQKRNEVFWNETLAPDSVDRLLDAKAFTNFKKYDKDGEHIVTDLKGDENLILKGNNLLAISSLLKSHRGKVKLIYIDPPYNTGNDFGYNDRFNHSAWLVFMKNRLEIAKKLLSNEGSIWINIDDREAHYLKVLTDEVFGRVNFVANIIWKKKFSPQNDAKYFSDMHDHILVFAKQKNNWKPNLLPRPKSMNDRYKNPDNDERGVWTSGDLLRKDIQKTGLYEIITPSGRKCTPPIGTSWRVPKYKYEVLLSENRLWFGQDGNGVPRLKRFLKDIKSGVVPQSIWDYSEVGHNQDARREIIALFKNDDADFTTPKPEQLLQRIIHIATNENDTVLDFFGGSGTTAAVAHKMNRKFITSEQMDYVNTVTVERLKKVIDGEDGGISKEVNWQGGGSFVYAELMEYNQYYISKIQESTSKEEIVAIWHDMQEKAFISYQFDKEMFNERLEAFKTASLETMQHYLIEILDKNQLYVNFSEIEDNSFKVRKEDKELNYSFYSKK